MPDQPLPPPAAKPARWRLLGVFAVLATLCAGASAWAGEDALPLPKDIRFWLAVSLVGLLWLLAVFFGPRSWSGKFALFAVVALPAAALALATKRVEFDGAMRPNRFVFRWEAEPPRLSPAAPGSAAPSAPLNLAVDPQDSFAEYRGPQRDGVSPGPALATDWKTTPPKERWRRRCGGGYGAFAAAGEALFSLEQRDANEAVVCYRRDTGAEVWLHEYPARFEETAGGPGPRATPTFHGGRVYAFGALGHLRCFDAATGKLIWAKNPVVELGASNLAWAMSGSPLVTAVGDRTLVVVNPGTAKFPKEGDRGGVAAYDAANGELVWTSRPAAQAGYSSPQLAKIAGADTVLAFDALGLAGFDPATGAERFRQKFETNQGINVSQPVLLGDDRVLIAASYLKGCAAVKVGRRGTEWEAKEEWRQRRTMQCKFTTPIAFAGHVYGISDTVLQCVSAADGKAAWRGPDVGYGQVVARGGLLLVQTEDGRVLLARMNPQRYEELGTFEGFRCRRAWNTPTLAGKWLYLRNDETMAAYELPLAP